MDTVALTINDKEVSVGKGQTVLQAAEVAGVYIPTLCYYPGLPPHGGCRMCLVEVEDMRRLTTACTTPVADGMIVRTDTPQIDQLRRDVLELILTEHPHACFSCDRRERCSPLDICLRNVALTQRCVTCPKNGHCELQKVVDYVGVREISLPYAYKDLPVAKDNPFFDRDYNLCILCGRCVRVCQEIRLTGAIAFTYRGSKALIGTAFNAPLEEADCQFCGACVDVCPTGALVERSNKWAGLPDYTTTTTCPYCGVGCQLNLEVRKGKINNVTPSAENSANQGQACVKGRFGIGEFVHHGERLTSPLVKRGGEFMEVTWMEALELVADNLLKYKGDQFAAISSAKCTNEDNYVIQKFARAVMGTNNIDHCARLCHAPTVAGLAQCFGSGAMTNSINEIGDAGCILSIGSNTTSAHPIVGLEVKKAVSRGAKLIVANPREIDLCRSADLWLQHRPGSDVALLMGMMRFIVDEGLADQTFIRSRCENYEAFLDSLSDFGMDFVEKITGVPRDKIAQAARIYATQKPSTILYAMGITQHSHGTDNVIATANLAMLTGNVGKPSTGVNPLRGQNNVQGACDMGALPTVYPGYQAVTDPNLRQKFEDAWGVSLSPTAGLALTEIFPAVLEGNIKAMYLVGENPVLSDPDSKHVREALDKLDFLVVQDIFLTETARLADVVLPAASFAEKDGTFTNTERRVQRVRQAIEPIGDSRPDWWITCQIAERMGGKGFDFEDPSHIMQEITSLTPSYGGISHQRLEKGGLQWPCPTEDYPGTPILHEHTFARGKGKFMPLKYTPPAEEPDDKYPFILTTERSLYHFHTSTMTRKVRGLTKLRPEETVEINPADAEALGISDGQTVKVASRRGEITAKAKVTPASPPGVVTMSFHFAESPTNLITSPALDPVAKIPELKVCAVNLEAQSR